MTIKSLICLISLLAVAATNAKINTFEPLKAKLTVKVLDEAGHPFPNVDVQIGFEDPKTRRNVYSRGKTDADGLFTAEGTCDGSIAGGIQKDGYYWSGVPFKITGAKDNHWLPWNPTCVTVLRPIVKPIALYAKRVDTDIPALNKPCGFDLEAGDWIMPYGKGINEDLIFLLHQERRGLQDYDVIGELTFKNPLDGIQASPMSAVGTNSVFKWERHAPENGYQPKFQLQNSWHGDKGIIRSFKFKNGVWEGYFFRVRTVERDDKIVSAHYGKIRGGIEVFPHDANPKIVFTYYLNPTTNDRNMEFDPKRNLFTNLKEFEQVSAP